MKGLSLLGSSPWPCGYQKEVAQNTNRLTENKPMDAAGEGVRVQDKKGERIKKY